MMMMQTCLSCRGNSEGSSPLRSAELYQAIHPNCTLTPAPHFQMYIDFPQDLVEEVEVEEEEEEEREGGGC